MNWTFYPVFVGTITSVVTLTRIAYKNHDTLNPKTLSRLAAAEDLILRQFSRIIVFCNTCFVITCFGFIAPRLTKHADIIISMMAVMTGSIYLTGIFPDRRNTTKIHLIAAQLMGVSMILLSYLFCLVITEVYGEVECILAVTMTILGILTFFDKKQFIFYELPLIFISHFTLVVAALVLASS